MRNTQTKEVTVRNLQHNLAAYLEIAKTSPVLVTKHGKKSILLINPAKYDYREKSAKPFVLRETKFIGMYKNRKDWQGQSGAKVAQNLREHAWYGR